VPDNMPLKSGKLTAERIEDILKAYRHICWRIRVIERIIEDEAEEMEIDSNSFEFLEKVFYQNKDIKVLADNSKNLSVLYIVKNAVDCAVSSLRDYPDNGAELYEVINQLYIVESDGRVVL
jgi:hypothetical protein